MRPTVLFISEQTLKDRTPINENIEPKDIRTATLIVQEEKILPCLGTALYNRLITGITEENLTADETTLMNDYIVPAMGWYVLSELPMIVNNKIFARGVVRKTGENAETLGMDEMMQVMDYYERKAENQKKRLINFLKQQSGEGKFSEYINPGSGIDTVMPESDGYTCPFVLDEYKKRVNGYDYDRNDL